MSTVLGALAMAGSGAGTLMEHGRTKGPATNCSIKTLTLGQ